jgi:hypothetical protein
MWRHVFCPAGVEP